MVITSKSGHFEIAFNYNPKLKDEVKAIPGARWNPVSKVWTAPSYAREHINRLRTKYKLDGEERVEQVGEIDPLPELQINIDLKREMFPYQKKGVAYSLKYKRVIVGDQPGLGKTGQSIAAMVGAKAKCILVICPATLRENWKREWNIWTGKNALVMSDRIKTSWPQYYKSVCAMFLSLTMKALKNILLSLLTVRKVNRLGLIISSSEKP